MYKTAVADKPSSFVPRSRSQGREMNQLAVASAVMWYFEFRCKRQYRRSNWKLSLLYLK